MAVEFHVRKLDERRASVSVVAERDPVLAVRAARAHIETPRQNPTIKPALTMRLEKSEAALAAPFLAEASSIHS